jgi:hypothetical protein
MRRRGLGPDGRTGTGWSSCSTAWRRLCFASPGALFGTTVQRGAVSAAPAEAVQTRDVAAAAGQEAMSSAKEAARAKALATMDNALGNGEVPTDSNRPGARADDDLRLEPSLAGALVKPLPPGASRRG